MTLAHIIKSATAPIITSGTRDRKNVSAPQVSNIPATARAMPGVTEIPVTASIPNVNARRDIHGMRHPDLAFVRGLTGAR